MDQSCLHHHGQHFSSPLQMLFLGGQTNAFRTEGNTQTHLSQKIEDTFPEKLAELFNGNEGELFQLMDHIS